MINIVSVVRKPTFQNIHPFMSSVLCCLILLVASCTPIKTDIADNYTESENVLTVVVTEFNSPTAISPHEATASPDATPIVMSVMTIVPVEFPTSPLVTPVPEAVTEELAPVDFSHFNWQIAFAVFNQPNSDTLNSDIWLINSSAPWMPVRLLEEAALLSSNIAWSHDGKQLAYAILTPNDEVTVAILNIDTREERQLPFSVLRASDDPNTYSMVDVFSGSWSLDDRWLAIHVRYKPIAESSELLQTVLVNTVDGEVIQLDEKTLFKGWSPKEPDQYLYFSQNGSGGDDLAIGITRVNENAPVYVVNNIDSRIATLGHAAWSADAAQIVVSAYDDLNRNITLLLDLERHQWRTLQSSGHYTPFSWSPDGKWVALSGSGLYFWSITEPEQPVVVVTRPHFIAPIGWLPQSNHFVYQEQQLLNVVSPLVPESFITLLDLASLNIESQFPIRVEFWMEQIDASE